MKVKRVARTEWPPALRQVLRDARTEKRKRRADFKARLLQNGASGGLVQLCLRMYDRYLTSDENCRHIRDAFLTSFPLQASTAEHVMRTMNRRLASSGEPSLERAMHRVFSELRR